MINASKNRIIVAAIFAVTSAAAAPAPQVWVASWGTSQMMVDEDNALPAGSTDTSVRQIFHLSAGGKALRVRVSNAFGAEPLRLTSVHVARPLTTSPDVDPATDKALSFAGDAAVSVPPGSDYLSDPLDKPVAALSDLAITFHFDQLPARQTGHPGSRATSWYTHGDAAAVPRWSNPKHTDHWFLISGIDVQLAPGAASVVALGDSITDGHGATTNGNNRWTDVLAARLQHSNVTRDIGVSNQGIGGNHLLTDGIGPNALARFDRDVLASAGVRWLIVFEGVNDLGGLARNGEVPSEAHAALVQHVLAAYQQIIARAHAHGIRVFGATIEPYVGSDYYHPGPQSEADRQAVNEWIRAAGHFDAFIDFDKVVRDTQYPDRLLPDYDCGDHLHPSPAGYKAMGESILLSLFAR